MQTLGKLFGSEAKIKLMRLFLLNPEHGFEVADISRRARIPMPAARREAAALASARFITRKITKRPAAVSSKGKRIAAKRVPAWFLDSRFPHLESLRTLILDTTMLKKEELAARFKGVGKVKLLTASGIFTRDPESRLDLMIVGNNLKKGAIDTAVRNLEAEIGKELAYAVFETADFVYRLGMYDKLVRDVIDFPHETIIDAGLFKAELAPKAWTSIG